jgi:hypothetical protein
MPVEEAFPIFDLELPPEEPYATHRSYRFFFNMIHRAKQIGVECQFTLGRKDFGRWCDIVGPIPDDMERPSIGRYDHSKGYVFDVESNRWNFRWQERSENCRESGRRAVESGRLKVAQRASVRSPNHISHAYNTCSGCGVTRRGPQWKHHCNNVSCGWGVFPVEDVILLIE